MDYYRWYESETSKVNVRGQANNTIEIHRYRELGIGFEMQKGKVTTVTLYPPVHNP